MMPLSQMTKMVVSNTLRSPKDFVLSAFGIVIGIAAFVFFMSLTSKVGMVLEKIFPLEQVQVVAPRAQLFGKDMSKKLDDAIVAQIRKRPEVKAALPRMSLTFPAYGRGDFEGQDLKFEVGGFADGVDPAHIGTDPALKALFKDWDEAEKGKRVACVPPPNPLDDEEDAPARSAPATPNPAMAMGSGSSTAPALVVVGNPRNVNPCPNPDRYYCDESDRTCHHRVPVVVSPTLLELYNGQFAKSHGLPIIDADLAKFVVERGGLSRMRFTIGLGQTIIAGSNAGIEKSKRRRVEAALIGISSAAMPIGMTVPIEYIRRWNREFRGEEAATAYSSIIVTLRNKDRLAMFGQWLQDDLDLRLEDSLGERFATVILVVQILFLVISVIIIVISAINIAHNFFMQVTERRRELGILRAVGATQSDVRLIIIGEAAIIGIVGAGLGVLLAIAAGATLDWLSARYVQNFPFKPKTWFDFEPWIWLSGIGLSTVFCIVGGYLPARKAAKIEPAAALTQS